MEPKEYYYKNFRSQLNEWAKKSYAHEHPGDGIYIPIQDLKIENLSHVPENEYMLFHCALACTVLIDQTMYSHFKNDYLNFQEMTRYPKIEAGISNVNVNPWLITHSGIGLTTLERFLIFFIDDLKNFFTQNKFKEATWETVKKSMLNDPAIINGSRGEILKRILEQQDQILIK